MRRNHLIKRRNLRSEGANEPLVFFDVDTQVDFMRPTGRLHVPGAEQIVPNLARLMNWARENDVPVISSADAHSPDDPNSKSGRPIASWAPPGKSEFPKHCFHPIDNSLPPGRISNRRPHGRANSSWKNPPTRPRTIRTLMPILARAGSAACSGFRRGYGILRPRRHIDTTPAGISGGFGDRCDHAHYRGWRR